MTRATMLLAALAMGAAPAIAREPTPVGLKVERVVLLMRHGVRPPTKDPAMPAGVAVQPWPAWPVPPGWLTPHGAAAIRLLGAADRTRFAADGLLPASGCPRSGSIRLVADSDQRTIATAEAYRDKVAPGCAVTIEHRPQGEDDPLFTRMPGDPPIAAETAMAAVLAAAGPGGIAGEEARSRPALARLDAILCGTAAGHCGVRDEPTTLTINAEGRPKLAGALDRGSTAAQILLLQYAEGKPAAEVGWGRADAAAVTQLSALHAQEFALLARPLPLARRNMARLGPLIRDALAAPGTGVTMIAGHDTNVASLAGLIGVHWQVPGFAADDPAPGGALVLERLADARGWQFVRVRYRSQTLEQIRTLAPIDGQDGPMSQSLAIGGCGGETLCPLARFSALLQPLPAERRR